MNPKNDNILCFFGFNHIVEPQNTISHFFAKNLLTGLDSSANTALAWLNYSYNDLTELNVSIYTTLTWLNCSYNSLTGMDASGIIRRSQVAPPIRRAR